MLDSKEDRECPTYNLIHTDHQDTINNVAFNLYADRMATCSRDTYVRVFNRNEGDQDNPWILSSSWKASTVSVWRVTWANPQKFGQVLASCSCDRTIVVWEEIVGDNPNPGSNSRCQRHWVRRASLVDATLMVMDIKFLPEEMGLQLAACTMEGIIRIYECPDVLNLCQWILKHEINCKLSLSCLTITRPRIYTGRPPLMAAGSDDKGGSQSGGKIFIIEYSSNRGQWVKQNTISSITEPVNHIAFAPSRGRSFHVLAVATNNLRIIHLTPIKDDQSLQTGLSKHEIETVAQFNDHSAPVQKVSWSSSGGNLYSAGDDNNTRVFKQLRKGEWKSLGIIMSYDDNNINVSRELPKNPPAVNTARYIKLGKLITNRDIWH